MKYNLVSAVRRFRLSLREVNLTQLFIGISTILFFLCLFLLPSGGVEQGAGLLSHLRSNPYVSPVISSVALFFIFANALFPNINLLPHFRTLVEISAPKRKNTLLYFLLLSHLSIINILSYTLIGLILSLLFDIDPVTFLPFFLLLWLGGVQLSIISFSLGRSILLRTLLVVVIMSPLLLLIIDSSITFFPPFALVHLLEGMGTGNSILSLLIGDFILFFPLILVWQRFEPKEEMEKEHIGYVTLSSIYRRLHFLEKPLGRTTYALFVKELLQLLREKGEMLTSILILMFIWVLATLIVVSGFAEEFSVVVGVLIVIAWVPFYFSEGALSRERDTLWIIKIAKVPSAKSVVAKYLSIYGLSLICSTILIFLQFAIASHFNENEFLYPYLFGILVVLPLSLSYGIVLSFTFPTYRIRDDVTIYSPKLGSISQSLEMASMFLILVPSIVLYACGFYGLIAGIVLGLIFSFLSFRYCVHRMDKTKEIPCG